MKREVAFSVLLICFLLPFISESKGKIDLSEKYKKWLDEEVVYIITVKERDVFLKLQTDRERDLFIEAFWKQRNPDPGAARNELKEEHYRRLQYANEIYGRGSYLPGWKTDRGKIYIILGPPKNIESYDNVQNVNPTQIWFYLGDPASGLPPGFNVIFFKREGMGNYVLYSPSADGPQSLITGSVGSYRDEQAAYQALKKQEPNLARQVLTLIPGERVLPGTISLASNTLMSHIYSAPQKKVSDSYADALLKYKDIVEVEYTANYIASDALIRVLKDDSGFFLVHYSIEPKKLAVEDLGGQYTATFELNGRVSEITGRTIFQYDKEIPLNLTKEQLQDVRSQSFELQDMFPLVPGRYKFDLLLKNRTSKEFSSIEGVVVVPGDGSSVQLSPLVLGYRADSVPAAAKEIAPFKMGELQILCPTRNTFTSKESLVVFFQVYDLTDGLKSQGSFKFTFFREDKEFRSWSKKIGEYPRGMNFVERCELRDFPPAYYKIEVSLVDESGKVLSSKAEQFEISAMPDMPRPIIFAKVMPVSALNEYVYASGIQYLNKGNAAEAETFLEKAYRQNPDRVQFVLGYGQALFIKKDFAKVKAILSPFADKETADAEVLSLLGRTTHALGRYGEAITQYKNYLSKVGTNLEILNLLGTCYFQLGNREEALAAWQKSLEINPNQANIKKLVDSLKVYRKDPPDHRPGSIGVQAVGNQCPDMFDEPDPRVHA
jgi:GWxTD domain-containing protein